MQDPLNQHGRCFRCYFQLWCEDSPELFLREGFFFFLKPLRVPPVHPVLAAQGLSSDRQKEGRWPGQRHEPAAHVTRMESVSPSEACLGQPFWSPTPHRLKTLGKRFLSGKGFLRARLSGCCTLIPCQIAAVTTASASRKAGVRVLFNVLVKCQ